MSTRSSSVVAQVTAVARRDALIQISYQFRLATYFVEAIVVAFLAFYVSDLVGESELIEQYDGSYFDFVVVGIALTSYAALGVRAFTAQIMEEQMAGTLEPLLSGPSRLRTILAGGFIVPLLLTTIEVALLLGIGIGGFGVGLSFMRILVSLPVIVLTVVNFCAMGIAAAAVLILAKRGDPISGLVFQATLVLSGAIFPIALLPFWVEWICRLTPAYYGVRGMREALLTDAGLAGTADEIVVLTCFAAISVPISLWLFGRAVTTAKRIGVLASY